MTHFFNIKYLTFFLLFLLYFILALHLARHINLINADIGRYLITGQSMCSGNFEILYRNYDTLSFSQYPFINHSWGYSVFAFIIWILGGFNALSFSNIIISLIALTFFLKAAFIRGQGILAILLALLLLPMLSNQKEVRPEVITLLFSGIYFYYLTSFSLGKTSQKALFFILPLCQIFWVNFHIMFFMGPFLVALFCWESLHRGNKEQAKSLGLLFLIVIVVNVVNPSGLAGMTTPIIYAKVKDYPLIEMKNIFQTITLYKSKAWMGYVFFGLCGLTVLTWIALIKNRLLKRNIVFFAFLIMLLIGASQKVRFQQMTAMFAIPLLAHFITQILDKYSNRVQEWLRLAFLGASVLLVGYYQLTFNVKDLGIGLIPHANASAEFFKQQQLKGPIFSDYGLGSYLIFHFWPQEKLFIHNAMENYPKEFFQEYFKVQENREAWLEANKKYQFNVIYYKFPWYGKPKNKFLSMIDQDPEWAMVYRDQFVVMYLKRNEQNLKVIQQYEIKWGHDNMPMVKL